jgi:hypothetical protein
MNTQSLSIQSSDGHRLPESASRRIRTSRRSAAARAPRQDHTAAPSAASSPDRPDAARQVGGVGGARILRRWSVSDLIARAAGAPSAIA